MQLKAVRIVAKTWSNEEMHAVAAKVSESLEPVDVSMGRLVLGSMKLGNNKTGRELFLSYCVMDEVANVGEHDSISEAEEFLNYFSDSIEAGKPVLVREKVGDKFVTFSDPLAN